MLGDSREIERPLEPVDQVDDDIGTEN